MLLLCQGGIRFQRVEDDAGEKSFEAADSFAAALAFGAFALVNGDDGDAFPAVRAWLYVSIVGAAYIVSRGIAKAGSHEPYWATRDDLPGGDRD